jgi:uncharacterized protein (TIGR03437 family)
MAVPTMLTISSTGKLAATIGDVQVWFNGTLAPMIYASSTQVSAVVPYEMASVASPGVWIKYAGQTSNAFQLTTATTAPGLFTQNASGSGAILNQDNSVNGPGNRAAAGEAPGLVAGMMQLNVQIPANAPSGDLQILVSIGGNTSQKGVTVSVQ